MFAIQEIRHDAVPSDSDRVRKIHRFLQQRIVPSMATTFFMTTMTTLSSNFDASITKSPLSG